MSDKHRCFIYGGNFAFFTPTPEAEESSFTEYLRQQSIERSYRLREAWYKEHPSPDEANIVINSKVNFK